MFSNHFTTNFSQNAAVKKFWTSVNIWQTYGQNFVAYFFGPPCICSLLNWVVSVAHEWLHFSYWKPFSMPSVSVMWSGQSHSLTEVLTMKCIRWLYTEQQRMYCNIVGRFLLHCVRNFCTSSVLILVLQFTVRNVLSFLSKSVWTLPWTQSDHDCILCVHSVHGPLQYSVLVTYLFVLCNISVTVYSCLPDYNRYY